MRLHLYHNQALATHKHSPFWNLELSIWLHVFGRSLVDIFIPAFLLLRGYSLRDVLIFFLLLMIFDVPLNFTARYLTRKIGARWVMVLAAFASTAFFLLLNSLTAGQWPVLTLMALLAALYDTLFFVSHLYLFIEGEQKRANAGLDTGILFAVKRIAMLIGPIIGAAILLIFSQQVLIFTSLIFFALSLLPLLHTDDLPDRPVRPQLKAKQFFSSRQEKINYWSVGFYSLHEEAELTLWPLFIYLLFGRIESVAAVSVILSISSIIFSLAIGKNALKNKRAAMAAGSLLLIIIWLARLTFSNTIFYYASVFLVGIFTLLVSIPLMADLYARAKTRDPLSASMWRNTISMASRLVLYAILLLFTAVFKPAFVIAAGSLFILLFVILFPSRRLRL